MSISVKDFLFGNAEGEEPSVTIEIQLFDRDGKFYLAYVALAGDKQKAGTATVEKDKINNFLVNKMAMLSEKLFHK